MGFPVNVPNDNYRVATLGANNPATEIAPEGAWSGFWSAAGSSVVGGLGAVWKTLSEALVSVDPLGVTPEDLSEIAPFHDQIKSVQEWAKVDPRTHGAAAQVAGGVTRGLTIMGVGSLFGGPLAGATTLGVTEGYNDYSDSVEAGVDENTALLKAGFTGTAAFAGAFLPMKVSGKVAMRLAGLGLEAEVAGNQALAKTLYASATAASKLTGFTGRLGTGVAVNTGFGMANRYATSHLLASNGYEEMAKQYEALDAQAITADVVLGLAFGGWGHFEEKLGALHRPDEMTRQAAFEARRQEMISRGAVGVPKDPAIANLDATLQERALTDLIQGRDPVVHPDEAMAIAHGVLPDPERMTLHQEFADALTAMHGDFADFTPPEHVELPPLPPREPVAAKPPSPPAAEGAPKVSPFVEEHMAQIAEAHPDMEVQLPDGRIVRMADLSEALSKNMAEEAGKTKLVDAAVGCFLRTIL